MKAENMTEKQMRQEIEEDLGLNMFVEAGAGAGKTTLIVRRVVNMLSNGVEPGEIVVITFTNAAAEELRGRIIKELKEKSKKDPALEEKLHRLNDMNISTIHSFCNVLLHEQGLVTGLPIDIEMVEGEDDKKEKKRYFDEFLKGLTRDDWDVIEENGTRFKSRKKMEELFLQIADLPEDTKIVIPEPRSADARKQKHALDVLRSVVFGDPAKSIPTLEQRLLDALNSCVKDDVLKDSGFRKASSYSEARDLYCAEDKKTGQKSTPYLPDICEVLGQMSTVENENKVYLELVNEKYDKLLIPSHYATTGNGKIDKNKIQAANQKVSEEINAILTQEIRGFLPALKSDACKDDENNPIGYPEALLRENAKHDLNIMLAKYAVKARRYYRDHAKRNRITDDRLLELTRDLILNEDPRALKYFSKKYTRFFVDEFQDTDRIQESFIYRLASDPEDETKLRDGALFVVGDPKQSIYRFRGAQPAVYFSTKEKMEVLSNAKVYELAFNYRSNRDIIAWVNRKFAEAESIMPIVAEEGVTYGYQKMEVQKDACQDKNVIHGIYHVGNPDAEHFIGEVTLLDSKKTTCKGFQFYESEQEDDIKKVIALILDLTKKDEEGFGYFRITDYDDDHKAYTRDVKFSDFLLISGDTTQMDAYVSEMKRYGIPVLLDGKEDLHADRGLAVFVRLYQFLVNPRDPFYRTGAEEALRETLKIRSEKELREASLRILDCLYDDAKSMSAYGMAEYLERQISVIFDKETGISQVEMHSTQAHIRQMIESLCVNVAGTGIEMAEAMQQYLDTKLEHELSLEEGSKDGPGAVRFMNLHKTKGLQGNIVIFLDRRGRGRGRGISEDRQPQVFSEGKLFYPGLNGKGWKALKDYPQTEERALRAERAEFHRMEYVAVTRAAQAVIFMDVLKMNGYFSKKKYGKKIKEEELPKELRTGSPVYSSLDENTFSYQIAESPNILDWINSILPADKQENRPYEAKDPQEYAAKADDYTVRRKRKIPTNGMVVKESPSGTEKPSPTKGAVLDHARKEGRKKSEDYNWEQLRPVANVVGDILHRSMELLVGRKFTAAGIDIETSVRQAVGENRDRMYKIRKKLIKDLKDVNDKELPVKVSEITEEKTEEIVTDFIVSCAKAYDVWLNELWQNVEKVYPEVHFSYKDKNENKEVTTWMNGTADLILEMKDGTYRLIDYKSDNDFLLSEEDMEKALRETYSSQLEIYRGVIQTILGAEPESISTGIISFSQKDKNGKLLGGKNVRVRYTELCNASALDKKQEPDKASAPVKKAEHDKVTAPVEKTEPVQATAPVENAKPGGAKRGRKGLMETYRIHGKEHTGNQAEMMFDVLQYLMEKHFDKKDELAKLTAISLGSQDSVSGIHYFDTSRTCTWQGVTYTIGASYGRANKLSLIRRAIRICGEDLSQFEIEDL